jgi:hypothetical protein
MNMRIISTSHKLLNTIINNIFLDRTLLTVAVHLTNPSITLEDAIYNVESLLIVFKNNNFTFVYVLFKIENVMLMYNLKIFE